MKKSISGSSLSGLTIAVGAILISAPTAFAATTAEEGIEVVTVTGEKIARSLQDTASSVAVLTQQQIDEAAIYDIQEVFDRMANVTSAFAGEGMSIRGINYNSVGGGGNGGLVTMAIDGAVMSRKALSRGQKDLWDVSQIEVFRGAQSTNQGRNSLAGAVFMRTNDPTFDSEGKYRIAYGTNNTRIASFAYSNSIINQQLAFRIAIDDQSTDGFVTNPTLNIDDSGNNANTTIRAKLLFTPSVMENLSVLATFSSSENENGPRYVAHDPENGFNAFDRISYVDVLGKEDLSQDIAVLELDYEINETWDFSSITTYNESEHDRVDDGDSVFTLGATPSTTPVRRRLENDDTLTQELRLSFDTDKLVGLFGAYYFERDNNQILNDLLYEPTRAGIVRLLPSVRPDLAPFAETVASFYPEPLHVSRIGERGVDTQNWALFASVDYHFSDFVTLSAGLRYDKEEVDTKQLEQRAPEIPLPDPTLLPEPAAPLAPIVGFINNLITTEVLGGIDLDTKADYDAWLPRLGITLNWQKDLATSFTVQKAYRAGGAGIRNGSISGAQSRILYEYDPEYSTNYEFALRSQWFDKALTVNANLFYIDWTDQQIQLMDNTGLDFFTDNVGKSKLTGGELEISARVNEDFNVFANLGYTDTEFVDFPANQELGSSENTGNRFLASPYLTTAMGFGYYITDNLRINADANYQSNTYADVENTMSNDSRTLVNAKFIYQVSDDVELSLVARNLFDKEYIALNDIRGRNVVWVGDGRSVTLQLQGNW